MFKKKNLDAILILTIGSNKDPNIEYFTGMDLHDFSCVLINKHGKIHIVSGLEYENAKKNSKIKSIIPLKKDVFTTLNPLLAKAKRIGINESVLSVNTLSELKNCSNATFVDVSEDLLSLREIKTKQEQQHLNKACKYGDKIFTSIIKHWDLFRTESEIAAFILAETARYGLKPSFDPIVASGINASLPHYTPQNNKLKKGFCVIDFGVKFKGYCSDMTRTIFIGKPTKKEIALYALVLKAQTECVNLSFADTIAKDIDAHARNVLGEYSKYFIHGLGHQLGVEIHENSKRGINVRGTFKLKTGMAITIEPGIYIKNKLGIRIEDTIIVGMKPLVLTRSPKKLFSFEDATDQLLLVPRRLSKADKHF